MQFMEDFFGEYKRFNTENKSSGALLIGADNLIGDVFTIDFDTEKTEPRAWLVNKFGAKVGFFDPEFSHKLKLMAARDWKICALLAFVAYSENPEPGAYWGQAAVICYNKNIEPSANTFLEKLAKYLEDGIRPDIALGSQACKKLVESKGEWFPTKREPMPKFPQGQALVKDKRSASEKLIEQGRRGNKGCYLISILFLILLVALVIFSLKSCGVFG